MGALFAFDVVNPPGAGTPGAGRESCGVNLLSCEHCLRVWSAMHSGNSQADSRNCLPCANRGEKSAAPRNRIIEYQGFES